MKIAVVISRDRLSPYAPFLPNIYKLIGHIIFDPELGPPIMNREEGKSIEIKIIS
jgi:hypothetical protein